MRTPTALLLSTLLLAGCGGADPAETTNQAYRDLGASDWSGAVAKFESALDAIAGDASHPQYKRALLGLVEAKAHTDPRGAVVAFMEQADAGLWSEKEYSKAAKSLLEAGATQEATTVTDAGIQSYPENQDLAQLMDQIVAAAEKDPALTEHLKGLGYLGD